MSWTTVSSLLPGNNLIAPSGTRMPFNQSAAPVGWTIDAGAAFSDCTMRTVTGAGGGTGGSAGWSGWNFGGTFNINAFTISTAQLPAHAHTVNDPSHGVTVAGSTGFFYIGGSSYRSQSGVAFAIASTNAASANVGVGSTGSGAAIQPSLTTPQVKYSDYVFGVKV